MHAQEVTKSSLASIAQGLRTGEIRSADILGHSIACHAKSESRLGAYRTWCGDRAQRQAIAIDQLIATNIDLGPLMGIPVSVKDLYGVPGLPTFAGTDAELSSDWEQAGPLINALQSQLGVVVGKTHTVEFAFGGLGTNPHSGTPVNPWSQIDAPRAPGGSSAGAGVSLAQGTALLALGTDTAGSVRIPAAYTGQCALKITHGRWPLDGIVPLSPSLDTPGLLARSIADLAFAFASLDPHAKAITTACDLSTLRIGIIENTVWEDIEPSIDDNTRKALISIEKAGSKLHPVTLPCTENVLEIFRAGGLAAPELRAFMDSNFPERIARLDPTVMARVQAADGITAADYLQRAANLKHFGQLASVAFNEVDVLVSPTIPITAPLLSDLSNPDTYRRANMLALRNTALVNLFGWCAVTLPTGLDSEGIPTGLQLIAPPMQEERLLAVAQSFERTIGTSLEALGPAPLS
ncbi:amidase [Celeribacter halophilus]|uniref:amidase n=1 Tax=Celeribacter halophilus TaxID=576117 RepID=UPI001C097A1A|nr:amidase [Celeribacter halophilus]MBU2889137.1 amidase [Celeribacter halophilus]MDO6510336.1 amidase [Celeribacter halophilus]